MRKCDLRLWAVWDPVISRIEISSESQSACRNVLDLMAKNGRTGLQLLRFDLCPLYYDDQITPKYPNDQSNYTGFSSRPIRPLTQKQTTKKGK